MYCSQCGSTVPATGKFCAACGSAVNADHASTIAGVEGETFAPSTPRISSPGTPARIAKPISGAGAHSSSSDPIGGGRFAPGTVLEGRYRIVALAGRGGMGEVYRAEDLKLSQTVAIKFLPESLSQDAAALQRFHSEVRIARQVSHPNVCRMFDIGETNGIPYLSMEFVDGEDLSSLLRRIGRLPQDKAIEVARQICAGLAAAHERGVIHRDLKPANIMLDGLGKVRINDFGLAGIAATIQGAEIRAGTPAYMAPEQLSGREVTTKSDIYALGLVLYEILTGKRAFEASTIQELIRLREQMELTKPSTLVRDLDPLLERVILRCLENDPAQRPSSALQIAAALPGGDPLAAALAAGETPSPEMVAASGSTEGLHPKIALLCLLATIASLVIFVFIAKQTKLVSYLPFGDSPEVLTTHAREMIKSFGYTTPPADFAWGGRMDTEYLQHIRTADKSTKRWDAIRRDEPPAAIFWYRESPRPLVSLALTDNFIWGRVFSGAPAMGVSGMVLVETSPAGRLVHFEAVPPQEDSSVEKSSPPDWKLLLAAAGLTEAQLKPVPPRRFPLAWGDSRAAWEGTWPQSLDVPLRVEAAGYRGKPIYFEMISPWQRPERMEASIANRQNTIGLIFSISLLGMAVLGAILVARRNIKLGRGDYQGALRLGLFMLVTSLIDWALLTHYSASPAEFLFVILAISTGLFFAALTWLLYVALEPFVRRNWPDTIVSWTRMLKGQFRDPMLGRDLLLGGLFGILSAILENLQPWVESALGRPPMSPFPFTPYSLEGIRGLLATFFLGASQSLTSALLIFFLFFFLKLIFKKNWIAALALSLLFCIPGLGAQNPAIEVLFTAPFFLIYLYILRRFGLLALAALYFTDQLASLLPIATPLTAWYSQGGTIGLAVILLFVIYGFQVARAGKPLFSKSLLDT